MISNFDKKLQIFIIKLLPVLILFILLLPIFGLLVFILTYISNYFIPKIYNILIIFNIFQLYTLGIGPIYKTCMQYLIFIFIAYI